MSKRAKVRAMACWVFWAVVFFFPALSLAQEAAPPGIDPGDTAWILTSAALVLMMTAPGLALFYGGLVRRKNVLGTIVQSFVILALVSVQWVLWGYSLAFGPDKGGLIGSLEWFGLKGVGLDPNLDYAATIPHQAFMIYQAMFAVITPALITGAFAERMKFSSFLVFTLLWTTFIYDPLAHWVWGVGGWLRDRGALDFAGGSVVHISAGVSALAASVVIGKRRGYGHDPMPPHNLPLTVLGAGLLWVGWFGFNAGSALASGALATSAFVATNTGAAAGVLSWLITEWVQRGKPTVLGAASGAIAGLGAITPASGFVGPMSAVVIGTIAGYICYFACNLKTKLGYDDSLDVVGIHGIGGTWGVLATGLFASKAVNPSGNNGAFFGNPDQFGVQAIVVLATWMLAFAGTAVILKVLDWVMGLRVTDEEEQMGLDLSLHQESAYALGVPGYGELAPAAEALERREQPAVEPRPLEAVKRPAAFLKAVTGGRTPPTPAASRTPPLGALAEAARPPRERREIGAIREKPFKLVVKEADKKVVKEVWERLCYEYPQHTPQDFNDIYPYLSTVQEGTFAFRKGDPQRFKQKVENLLYAYGLEHARVVIES